MAQIKRLNRCKQYYEMIAKSQMTLNLQMAMRAYSASMERNIELQDSGIRTVENSGMNGSTFVELIDLIMLMDKVNTAKPGKLASQLL